MSTCGHGQEHTPIPNHDALGDSASAFSAMAGVNHHRQLLDTQKSLFRRRMADLIRQEQPGLTHLRKEIQAREAALDALLLDRCAQDATALFSNATDADIFYRRALESGQVAWALADFLGPWIADVGGEMSLPLEPMVAIEVDLAGAAGYGALDETIGRATAILEGQPSGNGESIAMVLLPQASGDQQQVTIHRRGSQVTVGGVLRDIPSWGDLLWELVQQN